jgi:hypothetical protein
MAAPRRTHLGTETGLSHVRRVYRTADAIEVDEVEGTDVSRRRVLLDEVVLVTLHRAYGLAFVLSMIVLLTVFGFLTLILALADRTAGLVSFGLTVAPPLAALGLRLALGVDTVTVFGRRTKAEIPFWFRKARAREVFRLVCRLARDRQERAARELLLARRSAAAAVPPALVPPAGPSEE